MVETMACAAATAGNTWSLPHIGPLKMKSPQSAIVAAWVPASRPMKAASPQVSSLSFHMAFCHM